MGGGLFGLLGVLLSVPAASELYTLLKRDVHRRLEEKMPAPEQAEEGTRIGTGGRRDLRRPPSGLAAARPPGVVLPPARCRDAVRWDMGPP